MQSWRLWKRDMRSVDYPPIRMHNLIQTNQWCYRTWMRCQKRVLRLKKIFCWRMSHHSSLPVLRSLKCSTSGRRQGMNCQDPLNRWDPEADDDLNLILDLFSRFCMPPTSLFLWSRDWRGSEALILAIQLLFKVFSLSTNKLSSSWSWSLISNSKRTKADIIIWRYTHHHHHPMIFKNSSIRGFSIFWLQITKRRFQSKKKLWNFTNQHPSQIWNSKRTKAYPIIQMQGGPEVQGLQ